MEKLLRNLEKNNMKGYFVENTEEACELVKSLICEGDTVTFGGSMTLYESGVFDVLNSGKYNLLDRNRPGISKDEINKIYREAYFADCYFASTNAITEDGCLYNVDGNANRVSAMLYGPKSVIVLVGKNKIVKNLDEAVRRVKTEAAPKNCVRLNCDTPCQKTGECISLSMDSPEACDGCGTDARICCNYVVMAHQRVKDRVKVIIINQDLGY